MSDQNSRQDWLTFALNVLIKKGPEHLKITPLCELKGVTKGSFYHHFKNRAVFIDSLMDHWYQTTTQGFIDQVDATLPALERLQALDRIINSHGIMVDHHIRAWALKEPSIRRHLEKIDRQRQDYLAECYREIGLPPQQAKDVALVAYSSFLGMAQIYPTPTPVEVERVTNIAMQALLPNLIK